MKYNILFKATVDLCDIDTIINYADQGWLFGESSKHNSFVVTLERLFAIEADNDDKVRAYATAVNDIAGIDKYVAYITDANGNEIDFENSPNNWDK